MKFTIFEKTLPLNLKWKISRGASTEKTNLFVMIDNDEELLGEIATNTRYGENLENVTEQFEKFFSKNFSSIDEVKQLLEKREIFHSLKFGIDEALILYHRKHNNQSIHDYLNIPRPLERMITSYSIPIMNPSEVKDYLVPFSHFRHMKLKVTQEGALELVLEVMKNYKGILRIDANEGWKDPDVFMNFQEKIKHLPIEFIEQPFPAELVREYKELHKNSYFPIMADESIEDHADFEELKTMFNMVNIKLMKAGTVQNAVRLIKEAHTHHMKVMLGCMIESSLGISMAMHLSGIADFFDLDGFLLLKEDPFKLIELKGDEIFFKS